MPNCPNGETSFLTVVGIGAMDDNATVLRGGIIGKNDFILLVDARSCR